MAKTDQPHDNPTPNSRGIRFRIKLDADGRIQWRTIAAAGTAALALLGLLGLGAVAPTQPSLGPSVGVSQQQAP